MRKKCISHFYSFNKALNLCFYVLNNSFCFSYFKSNKGLTKVSLLLAKSFQFTFIAGFTPFM